MDPLADVTVVVTRARQQASTLVDRLHALGASTLEVPVIAIAPAADGGAALATALRDPVAHDWIVVTSANGVDALVHAANAGDHPVDLASRRIAVVGSATADHIRRAGVEPALVPDRFVAEGLLEVFPAPTHGGARVLLAQADAARDVLADGLRASGWAVDEVVAYRTVAAEVAPAVRDAVAAADVVTFTSASTVQNFVAALGVGATPRVVASIGPITSAAARDLGVAVTIEADPHTIDGLVRALVTHMAEAT